MLAPSVAARRLLARCVLRIGRPFGLLLFNAPDTHAHLLVRAAREEAIECGRRLKLSLHRALGIPVSFAWRDVRPVRDQHHLANGLHYILSNAQRHGVPVERALDASSLPDLLGLRVIGSYTAGAVRELLPRLRQRDLLPYLGLTQLAAGRNLEFLREAAAAGMALPDLTGNRPEAVEARVAAIHVAHALGDATIGIARRLGVDASRVRAARKVACTPALRQAIERQLGLRESLSRCGGAPANPAGCPDVHPTRRPEPVPDGPSGPSLKPQRG